MDGRMDGRMNKVVESLSRPLHSIQVAWSKYNIALR